MTTKNSRIFKGFSALMVVGFMTIASCNNASTDETTSDTSAVTVPTDTAAKMDQLTPPVLDTLPATDTGRDTKVPRN